MMSTSSQSRSLFNSIALLISVACCCGAAKASKYEIVYRAGVPPLASFKDSSPFAAGTPLTITAQFDLSTANQWNIGAYFYTAPSSTFLIGSSTYEAEDPLEIRLSDPSWQSVGGHSPIAPDSSSPGRRAWAQLTPSSAPRQMRSAPPTPRRRSSMNTSTTSISPAVAL